MKNRILALSGIAFILSSPLYAMDFPTVGDTSTCQIQISIVKNFNGNDAEVGKDFNLIFGGTNTVRVLEKFDSGYTAEIRNKNGALDLRVIVEYNYMTEQFEFAGGSLIGFVHGTLQNCR